MSSEGSLIVTAAISFAILATKPWLDRQDFVIVKARPSHPRRKLALDLRDLGCGVLVEV